MLTGRPPGTPVKYVLGPLIVDGGDVAQAKASRVPPAAGGGWQVNISLTPEASKMLSAATAKALQAPVPQNEVAIITRGQVVSAPTVHAVITTGSITVATLTKQEADTLVSSLSPSASR